MSAGQCWHWFERDKAAAEAFRVLKPGGTLLICHYDWIPVSGNIVAATEELILKYNPQWKAAGGTGVYPFWFSDMAEAGFSAISSFSYDEPAQYAPEAWVGRIEASAGIAILDENERESFKAELTALISANYGTDTLSVPHRVFCVWATKSG